MNIVAFESGVKGKDGTLPPKPGVDYELNYTASDRVELIYKRDFLEYSEWGSQNLSPKITIYARDGRKFEQSYSFKLKANTNPPALEYLETCKSDDGYYVLCFKAKNMTDMAKVKGVNQLLHKDITHLWVSGLASPPPGNKINLMVGTAGFNITASGGRLLKATDVEALVSGGTTPADPWIIYFKTDVQVSGGTPKEFIFKLMDEKGLSGAAIKQSIIHPVNTLADLKSAIDSAADGMTIEIRNNIIFNDGGNQIDINKNLTIQGKDSGVQIDAAQKSRIFKVASGKNLTLKNLTLKNAKDNTVASDVESGGGGVYAVATSVIELIDVTIENCETAGGGAGIRIDHDSSGGGRLLLKNSKIKDNTYYPAGYDGTGVSGGGIGLPNTNYTAVIDGCEISGNKIDLTPMSNLGILQVKGCGIYGGQATITIKGKTKIENNTFIPKLGNRVNCYGMGIYMQRGSITIGETGASNEDSPIIQGHTKPNNVPTGSVFEGQALHVYDFTWYSGQIKNNGGSGNAVEVRGTFTNPNNLAAD